MSDQTFVRMTGADADENCPVMGGFRPDLCPKCHMKVILHCDDCKIQVSGCLCTAEESLIAEALDEAELALLPPEKRAAAIEARQLKAAKETLREHGFWFPEV